MSGGDGEIWLDLVSFGKDSLQGLLMDWMWSVMKRVCDLACVCPGTWIVVLSPNKEDGVGQLKGGGRRRETKSCTSGALTPRLLLATHGEVSGQLVES